MTDEWLQREAIVTVKAYPTPSTKYHETVCIAAVTKEEGWIRLYPVQYRDLPQSQQFSKYQLVRFRMQKHPKDRRPESYRPDENSFEPGEVLSTKGDKDWKRRREWVMPTVSPSMCWIQEEQGRSGKSLGMFQPKAVQDLLILDDDPEWSGRKQGIMDQMRLFCERQLNLEKIPFCFKFKYLCESPTCRGHTQLVIDWEIMGLYRNVRDLTSDSEDIKRKIRAKFLDQVCGPGKDTYFFVGNHSRYPASFMVLGVFWPPKNPQKDLF